MLVESVTYRWDAHTTSDDPSRYRSEAEVAELKKKDPIERYRAFLEAESLWSEIDHDGIVDEIDAEFDAALEAANAFEERDIEEIFAYVHDELPPYLADQLVTNASRIRWRTRGELSASMVVRTPYGAGVRALEHHSESLEGAYGHVPGLKLVVPSTPYDAKGLLLSAIRDPDPVLFMEPKRIYRSFREEVPEEGYEVQISEAAIRREGEEITVVSWGAMMQPTLDAVDNLGIDAEVIDLRTISPLDHDRVVDSVRKTGRAAIVHEAPRTGGWGSELVARINDDALFSLEAPVERITGFDVQVPLLAMEDFYIPNPPRIEEGITAALSD